jgi:hypothetical protein
MPPKKRKSAKKAPSAKKPTKTDALTTALKKKADRSRYTVGDLKKVYERGVQRRKNETNYKTKEHTCQTSESSWPYKGAYGLYET